MEFKKTNNQKIYEELKGDLYDSYMLSRYFEDIYNLNRLLKNKVNFSKNILHDTKDLKFNLVNFLFFQKINKNDFMNLDLQFMRKYFISKFLINF